MNKTKNEEIERHVTSLNKKLALSRIEAAAAIGVSTASLDRLRERGLLKPSLALRRPLYPIFEIERFLRETTLDLSTECRGAA